MTYNDPLTVTHSGKDHGSLGDGAESDLGAVQAMQEVEEGRVRGRGENRLHVRYVCGTGVHAMSTKPASESTRMCAMLVIQRCVQLRNAGTTPGKFPFYEQGILSNIHLFGVKLQ